MEKRRVWVLDPRISWAVLITFLFLSLVPNSGDAAMVGSRMADGTHAASRAAQIEQVRKVLEKEVVVQKLADYGFSAKEISEKLPSLSDEQLHQLAGMSHDLAAGSDVGILVAVLLVVFLVILILMLLGRRVVVQ